MQDVTVLEGSTLNLGTELLKIWKVKNTGSVAWPAGTTITHYKGNRFGRFEVGAVFITTISTRDRPFATTNHALKSAKKLYSPE